MEHAYTCKDAVKELLTKINKTYSFQALLDLAIIEKRPIEAKDGERLAL